MSEPIYEPLHLGNTADDDGQVIDSLFMTVAEVPRIADEIIRRFPTPVKTMDRMITFTQIIYAGKPPVQLLPADMNRKKLMVRANSTGQGSDGVLIGDDSSKVFSTMSGFLLTTEQTVDLPFNGPIYAYAPTADCYVYVLAVTE